MDRTLQFEAMAGQEEAGTLLSICRELGEAYRSTHARAICPSNSPVSGAGCKIIQHPHVTMLD